MNAEAQISLALWLGPALLACLAAALWLRAHLAESRERRRLAEAKKSQLHIPASLHPVINSDRCISSQACVRACPEGDVLGLIAGAGRLIEGSACIGHGRCAVECPVDAIKLVFGTAERGVDIPYLSSNFETSRPGVYIAGELGGMGLIRNAMRQGVGAAHDAIARLGSSSSTDVDVAIVGAGPAGIGAALTCIEQGVSYGLLEQDSFGGTVAHYPRQKLILTEPISVPLFGKIHRREMRKEELLDLWARVRQETQLQVDEGFKLLRFTGDNGHFVLESPQRRLRAKKIILAIGRRGSPRTLGVAGEDLPHVTYSLVDADQYSGKKVLVVGGGDSALEAACRLAELGVDVALSYRGQAFYRARAKNRDAVAELAEQGRAEIFFSSQVRAIEPAQVLLDVDGEPQQIAADYVICALGGTLPTGFLSAHDIKLERWFGDHPQGGEVATTRVHAPGRRPLAASIWTLALLAIGFAAMAWLWLKGQHYYLLDAALREADAMHARWRSGGVVGHGVGVLATLVMLGNFSYALRKRWRLLLRLGSLARWLDMHVVVGLLAPAFIALHAVFKMGNLISTGTFISLGAVVTTGALGRFVYGWVTTSKGSGREAPALKKFMRTWRIVHVVFALAMVAIIGVHVAVTVLFGYRWIF